MSSAFFQAGQLVTYRFCDNVWTFLMEQVDFRDMGEVLFADKVKIVACDGRAVPSKLQINTQSQIFYSFFSGTGATWKKWTYRS